MHEPELDLNTLFDAQSASGKSSGKAKFKKKSPPQRSRIKVHPAILCVILLVAGFAAGFFTYELLDKDTVKRNPVINYVSSYPILESPGGNEQENCHTVYSDVLLTCYQYTEALGLLTYSPHAASSYLYFSLSDGENRYDLDAWPIPGTLDSPSCNFFLRVEFTDLGKKHLPKLSELQLMADGESIDGRLYLDITGYNDGEGWFIFGHLPYSMVIDLQYIEPVDGDPRLFTVYASPIGLPVNEIAATKQLVDHILNDDQLWSENGGELPETFSPFSMPSFLLEQDNCIPILLEFLEDSGSLTRLRLQKILDHPAFQAKMNDVERLTYQELKQYFTVYIYSEAITEINMTLSPVQSSLTTYFDTPDGRWRVSSEIPEALINSFHNYNFFARLELSDFAKLIYDPEWEVLLLGAPGSSNYTLGVREYYDSEMNVAGWFLYGYTEKPVSLQIMIQDAGGETLYGSGLYAVPIDQEFLYG